MDWRCEVLWRLKMIFSHGSSMYVVLSSSYVKYSADRQGDGAEMRTRRR